ncbi:MAG TPA: hypothetical protein VGP17_06240 [Solirubrobacteraceae bacterium]|jgi:hypothetical protein|nr:hypothetical protein [Solirubrobacteraceae bacterium]
MRTSLFHRAEPRRSHRGLPHLRRGGTIRAADQRQRTPQIEYSQTPVGRAQAAGGPIDEATYVCGCGLMFSAPVSTTVACPHCGCEQAW